MHTAGNRLLAFARKPAPVQATYLAYCGKTGLGTIDYRLTDPRLDPPGNEPEANGPPSERPLCLPETYWCYRPLGETPPVGDLPAAPAAGSRRLPEQLLQSHAADAGSLERTAAGDARGADAAARAPRQPSRSGAGVSRRARRCAGSADLRGHGSPRGIFPHVPAGPRCLGPVSLRRRHDHLRRAYGWACPWWASPGQLRRAAAA